MRAAIIAVALLLVFTIGSYAQSLGGGGDGPIIVVEEPVGWGCDGITDTAECWACCFGEGASVYLSCKHNGGTDAYCEGQRSAAVTACKDEDC